MGLPDKKRSEVKDEQFIAADYIEKLRNNSAQLQDYTENEVLGGVSLVNMAKDYAMNLSFSIISSTGGDITPYNRVTPYRPYRVIDPVIWALLDNREIGGRTATTAGDQGKEIALVLDAGFNCEAIYHYDLPKRFFQALLELGSVKTFYLGKGEPIAIGREPTNVKPAQIEHALVGPILDQLTESALVLVVTNREVLDLKDYDSPDWHDRLGIVTFDEMDIWPSTMKYNGSLDPSDQSAAIVKKFFLETL